ncbi:hypothetical protein CBM2589_A90904 [Cupriavidus taiwanensis]|uniref:Uncharacterized protein n=1 Tax=Cupriavidus taiwanensis TaxID=164546 RepID=A0A375CGS2_9BURK|nr:hypothetical protein CBM2589_A90904 [Cupriavidus taiwanensis]
MTNQCKLEARCQTITDKAGITAHRRGQAQRQGVPETWRKIQAAWAPGLARQRLAPDRPQARERYAPARQTPGVTPNAA